MGSPFVLEEQGRIEAPLPEKGQGLGNGARKTQFRTAKREVFRLLKNGIFHHYWCRKRHGVGSA